MPVITAILPDPRRPGRFELSVDGCPQATLSVEAIDRLHLATGTQIDERLEEEIAREQAILAVYDRALKMLALRARSIVELTRRLTGAGESRELVEVAIERLQRAGYLDDASFARQFARSKGLGTGLSRRRLSQELARKGVASDVSARAISEVFEEEHIDESDSLERVARMKMRSLARLDAGVQRRRLFAFLARRGYDSDDITRVVRALIHTDPSED